MSFTLKIENVDYSLEPYKLTMDWAPEYIEEHNNNNTGSNVLRSADILYSGQFTGLETTGTILDLREAFRATYTELRTAGVDVDTTAEADRTTMCTVNLASGGNEYDFDYKYGYIYDHIHPSVLKVCIFGAALDPADISGEGWEVHTGQYTIEIDYNGVQQLEEDICAVIIRHKNNFNGLDGTDSIILGSLIGCLKPIRQTTWNFYLDQLIPEYDLRFEVSTFDQWDEIEPGLLFPPALLATNYYGCAPIYMQPYVDNNAQIGDIVLSPGRAPSDANNNVYGAVYISSLYNIKINGVEYNPDAPADSQSDNTTPHDYNKKTFYDNSDYIPDDGIPVNDALDTGFIHAYNMQPSDAKDLADYMLTDSFIQGVKHLFADPIDYIISFVMLPVVPSVSGGAHVMIGGVDTGINGGLISNQFLRFSCGKLKCAELWNGFIDYAPNTRVSIFLPFVGIRELSPDDVMDGTVEIVYRIDVLTGEFIVTLCSDTSRALNGIIAAYNGTMGMDIPITAVNYQNKLNALTSAISGGIGVAAGVATGNAVGVMSGGASAVFGVTDAVMSKPTIERSSSLSGSSGVLGNFTPYFIIDRPVQALPSNYKKLHGYASKIGGTVGDFSGYLECEAVDLSASCTDAERAEIISLLKGGVFV